MSLNSDGIVQELQAEFQSMLSYVKDSRTATADQMERWLFKHLFELGARLLLLFFVQRSQAMSRQEYQKPTGEKLAYHGERQRQYFSIFGKLTFQRPYFYRPGAGGASPLDQELALGDDCYSDLLREAAEYLGVGGAYGKVADCLERLLGLKLSTQAISDMVAEDARDVEPFYAQQPPPPTETQASILVIQTDGKGVPMLRETAAEPKVRLSKGDKRSHKKEAVVTALYTIAPNPRTPEAVVESLFELASPQAQELEPGTAPVNKKLWATMAGKDTALERLAIQVMAYDGPHIRDRVALTDGAQALQGRTEQRWPLFTLILDFIHALEKLWEAANSLLGERSAQRQAWVQAQALQLLSSQVSQVVADLRHLAQDPESDPSQRATLTQVANYFERNTPYMDYGRYLAAGWPIASGVIEGACRHLVKDRCELSGMRWTKEGADNLLSLRAVAENDDWASYHRFRRQQRYQRLYGLPLPDQDSLEWQALQLPTPGSPRLATPLPQTAAAAAPAAPASSRMAA